MHVLKVLFAGAAVGVGLFLLTRFIQEVRAEIRKLEAEEMRRHLRGQYEGEDWDRWWGH
jgi:uncharacterized membrane protein YdfJ with MMPL/SSD domain